MTAASGGPGETPQNDRLEGGWEAAPIEHSLPIEETPAYGGGYYESPAGPVYPAYRAAGEPFPPPPPPFGPAFPPPAYPTAPPGAPTSPHAAYPPGGYPVPPPPPGYAMPMDYGTPYPGEYGFPGAQSPRTNTLAIVALVSSLVGLLCGIGAVIGIICGAVSLNQIKRTREDGHGLAVAGIAIGVAALVFQVVLVLFTH